MKLADTMTEAQFQSQLIQTAHAYGWLVTGFRPALTQSGRWSTPVQGDNGYPDLTLARGGVMLFAELKSSKGVQSADQKRWQVAMGDHYRLWRPSMIDELTQLLKDTK